MKRPFALNLLVVLACAGHAEDVLRVAQSGGTHTSLQSAVDACAPTGCRIELTDSVYTFSEPVSIRGKSDIEIVGARANGRRPILRLDSSARILEAIPDLDGFQPTKTRGITWGPSAPDTVRDPDGSFQVRSLAPTLAPYGFVQRFLLSQGRNPQGAIDPSRPRGWMMAPYSTPHAEARGTAGQEVVTHNRAALLQVDSSRGIQIRGLEFDGGAPMEILIKSIWGPGMWSEVGGLSAISLHRSLRGEILECDFHGWQAGVRSVDDNPGGLVTDLMSSAPSSTRGSWFLAPLSNPGAMGGHRIEGNLAHGNLVFVDLANSWDLASTIRYNRVWENGRSRVGTVAAWTTTKDTDAQWQDFFGGFMRLKDVLYPTPLVQGNTLVRNTLDVSHFGFRASTATLFLDNISVRRDQQRDWRELTNYARSNARNNWLAATGAATTTSPNADSLVPFCEEILCDPLVPAWGAASVDRLIVGRGIFGDDLGAVARTRRTPEAIDLQDQTQGYVERIGESWSVVLPVPVSAASSVRDLRIDHAQAQKLTTSDNTSSLGQAPLVALAGLLESPVSTGLNFLSFTLPAGDVDSIWRVEIAVTGLDGNSGRPVRSRLGTWLVRPMGRQLKVTPSTTSIAPGGRVEFVVTAVDSTGKRISLTQTPILNALGWNLDTTASPISARGAASAELRFAATAPNVAGISPVVFWTAEAGRFAATAGATYVQVGGSSSGVGRNLAKTPTWRIARVGDGATRVRIQGASAHELASARLHDARGSQRPVQPSGSQGELLLPPGLGGTWFLRIAGTSRPLVLLH